VITGARSGDSFETALSSVSGYSGSGTEPGRSAALLLLSPDRVAERASTLPPTADSSGAADPFVADSRDIHVAVLIVSVGVHAKAKGVMAHHAPGQHDTLGKQSIIRHRTQCSG